MMARMELLSNLCPPRIKAAYFKALWNDWVCQDRMKTLFGQCGCVLACGWKDDSLFIHYPCCSVYWRFVTASPPRGLGKAGVSWSRDTAFLISSRLAEADSICAAIRFYALHRTVNTIRFSNDEDDALVLLRLLD